MGVSIFFLNLKNLNIIIVAAKYVVISEPKKGISLMFIILKKVVAK
jgi:hypothetical protein